MGNEHDGIREALAKATTRSVRIPMRGYVESLNLSVAAALLLSAATAGRAGDLGPSERMMLYATGLLRSVPRADEILAASEPR
jgi:tRNA (guanosine-2'-O-)-methyltransferase